MRIEGLSVVVTGRIAGETRASVEAKLRQAGALVQSAVTGGTDVLVTGEAVGATKLNAACAKGVTILPWEQAAQLLAGGTVEEGAGVAKAPATTVGRTPRPGAFSPMLAKGADRPPDGGWLFEIKWDGYRCIATVDSGQVTLTSRSGLPLEFPQVEKDLEDLPDCVLDGEVVVLDAEGRSDFSALGNGHTGASYMPFDLVQARIGGEWTDVRGRPLGERKRLLASVLQNAGPHVAESPVFDDGQALLGRAAELGLEGIIAKRVSSTYQDGSRGGDWLKIKLRCEQEFVVAGWTPGKAGNTGRLSALVLAVNNGGGLVYAGRVGTGMTDAEADRLLDLLRGIPAPASPLAETPKEERTASWVDPSVVVQVEFQRWTDDGRLWHPSYKGQRTDKNPEDVRREPCAA